MAKKSPERARRSRKQHALPPESKDSSLSMHDLRAYAASRCFLQPAPLGHTLSALKFVQADPIRCPARAQDLILLHRVPSYRAGDLERSYPSLDIEEDFFINYGFVSRDLHTLMHPRAARAKWGKQRLSDASAVKAWIAQRGEAHPRDVDDHFQKGSVTNWFGGQSKATTHLLDGMHYRGMLRVARRDNGIRVYAPRPHTDHDVPAIEAMDTFVDALIKLYAPLPARSLTRIISMLRPAAPQWQHLRKAALARALKRLAHARIEGVEWYWPADENPSSSTYRDAATHVRILAPFDPVVWDRTKFELLWGWSYRFEAYTPAPKRTMGYYAMPLLWQDCVVGWCNAPIINGVCELSKGFVTEPTSAAFKSAWRAQVQQFEAFLDCEIRETCSPRNRSRLCANQCARPI